MNEKQKLLVIGNGMVGQYFLASLVKNSIYSQYHIVTFYEESRRAYDSS